MSQDFHKMTTAEQKQKVLAAEKQINDLHQLMRRYLRDNEIEPDVAAASLISLMARMIGATAGDNVEHQEEMISFIVKGMRVSLAENGQRPMTDEMMAEGPPWTKN